MKIRKTSFLLYIASIRKTNINLKVNIILNLAIYLKILLMSLSDRKDTLYMTKKDISL